MKKLFKWKGSKHPKENKDEHKEEPENRPKKSFFKRFYTSVFVKTEENHISKQQTLQNAIEPDLEDLILFYLLEINKKLMTNSSGHSQSTTEKLFIEDLVKEFNNESIDVRKVELCCMEGIPNKCKILRPICWKLMLSYLPPQKSKWKENLELKRIQYDNYVEMSFLSKKKDGFSMQSSFPTDLAKGPDLLHFKSCNSADHPLSREKNSNWNNFFNDQKLWDEVEKDTKRTKKYSSFFADINMNNEFFRYPNLSTQMRESTIDFENHYVAITRMLYVFAKKNPDLKYVQGMNEIMATLYYCFYNDENAYFKKNCEADAYFCFEIIMREIKENFLVGTDKKLLEMDHRTKKFSEIFKKTDLKLWEHLKKYNVSPEFYFSKWLILLFTQEFDLDEILVIWDPILASRNFLDYVGYLCLGILFSMRDQLVGADFEGIMQLLQNTHKIKTKSVLKIANNIYNELEKEEKK